MTTLPLRISRLTSSSFVRGVGILASGTAIGHAFTLAAAPILTRIYRPEDFGVLGLFASFLNVLVVVAALSYDVSIPSGKDEEEAECLTLSCLILAVPVSLAIAIMLWILIRFDVLGFASLPFYAPALAGLTAFFMGVFGTLRYLALRYEKFADVSVAVAGQNAARAVFQAGFGALGFHSIGLLLGETFGRAVGMSRILRLSRDALSRRMRQASWRDLVHALRAKRKFPIVLLPSSLLSAVALSIPVPLLVRLYGTAVGGYFSLVWKAIALPSVLITAAIADILHTQMAKYAREAPERVPELFRKTAILMFLVGTVPAGVLWFWGLPLFKLVFGAEWAMAGTISSIIAPWYLLDFLVVPLSRVVLVLGGQEFKLMFDVAGVAGLLSVFYFAEQRGLAALTTIRILTVMTVLLRLVFYTILHGIVTRFHQTHSASSAQLVPSILSE